MTSSAAFSPAITVSRLGMLTTGFVQMIQTALMSLPTCRNIVDRAWADVGPDGARLQIPLLLDEGPVVSRQHRPLTG